MVWLGSARLLTLCLSCDGERLEFLKSPRLGGDAALYGLLERIECRLGLSNRLFKSLFVRAKCTDVCVCLNVWNSLGKLRRCWYLEPSEFRLGCIHSRRLC